jgi:hypothetical protein
MRKLFLFFSILVVSNTCFSQPKAYLLLNAWSDELSEYNPTAYFDKVSGLLQNRLAVKQVIPDASSLNDTTNKDQLDEWVRGRISSINAKGAKDYFITMASELRLPLINISKIFFKNTTQTSRLVFYVHIYNASGKKIVSDTMISHGCVESVRTAGKTGKRFYTSYQNFMQDMDCHLVFIRKRLQELAIV